MNIQNSSCQNSIYDASLAYISDAVASLANSGLSAVRFLEVPVMVGFLSGFSIQMAYDGYKKTQESPRMRDRLAGFGMVGLGALGVTAAASLVFQNLFPVSTTENEMCREFFMKHDICCSNRTDTAIYSKQLTNSSIFSCFPNGSTVIESTPRLYTIS